jgi:hypothetical protein
MKASYDTTETERDLLDFGRRMLGSNLAALLFAGLGEPPQPHRRFTVQSTVASGHSTTYELEAVSEDGRVVPAGRDPLVLAAILHLLLTDKTVRDDITFRDEVLLDTTEGRLAITSAVERYYLTAYYLRWTTLRGPDQVEMRRSRVQQLITGYEVTTELMPKRYKTLRKSTVVYFAAGFTMDLAGEQKYFLGIDFERLTPLEQIPLGDVAFRLGC